MNYKAVIFDLDGVITKTAIVHAAAWKEMFDEYLRKRAEKEGTTFKEFTKDDYLAYVDGKPRYDGVKSFLESRGINIDFGEPEDAPGAETVCGLGNTKNIKFNEVLEKDGVEVYQSTVDLIHDLKSNDIHVGVASSSKNCQKILQKAGLEDLFETRVDGVVSAELGLKGKPAGDIFVRAAENMGVGPDDAAIVEDAVSGVQAGVNGGFALVIGVDREDNLEELKKNGADVVITDFEGINAQAIDLWVQENKK